EYTLVQSTDAAAVVSPRIAAKASGDWLTTAEAASLLDCELAIAMHIMQTMTVTRVVQPNMISSWWPVLASGSQACVLLESMFSHGRYMATPPAVIQASPASV